MSDNPFDSIDPLGGATGVSSSANPYDAIDPMDTGQPSSSAGGAFARSAARNAIPAAGGLLGAARGAEIGAGLGALIPGLGETGVSEFVGGVGGALIGGIGGSWLTGKAQDVAIEHAPEKWRDPLEAQESVDTELHPTATFAGGLAPYALTMSPFAAAKGAASALPENASTLMRLMSHPVTGRLLSGGLMGGMELSQEALQGHIDPSNIAIATAFGTVFTKPNKFGEAISSVGSRLTDFHPKTEPPPTVIQGDAAGITGAGANSDTFDGTHERPPELQREAERRDVEEKEVLGTAPEPQPDLRAIARKMEPDLFERADTLDGYAATLKAQLDAMSNPTDAMMSEAQARKAEIDAQLASHVEGRNGYSGGPEARRLRAMSRAAQGDVDDLQARRDAFANGEAVDTPEMAAIRQQLMAVRQERMGMGRDVAAAMRRAADRANGETVEAEPAEATEPTQAAAPKLEQYEIADPIAAKDETEKVRVKLLRDKEGRPEAIDSDEFGISKIPPAFQTLPGEQIVAHMLGSHPQGETPDFSKVSAVGATPKPTENLPASMTGAPAAVPDASAGKPIKPRVGPMQDMTGDQIEEDVRRQLLALGVPFEQASARAKVEAAFFTTLAARAKGAFGTAGELYAKHGPVWKGRYRGVAPSTAPTIADLVNRAQAAPSEPTAPRAAEPVPPKPSVTPKTLIEKTEAAETSRRSILNEMAKSDDPAARRIAASALDSLGPAPEPPPAPAETPASAWQKFKDAQQPRAAIAPPGGGFNGDRSRNGVLIRKKASQAWEAGSVVDVGFAKDLLVVSKGDDGAFTLVSKPNADGVSRRYSMRPHQGLARDGETPFMDAVAGIRKADDAAPAPVDEPVTADAAPAASKPAPAASEPPRTAAPLSPIFNTSGTAIGRMVQAMALSTPATKAQILAEIEQPRIATQLRALTHGVDVETPNGRTTLPDSDHAELFQIGQRLANGEKMDGKEDVATLRRLLERFEGYTITEPEYGTNFETSADVEELARDYHEHVLDAAARGRPAGDMLSTDEARVAWARRSLTELAAKATPDAMVSVRVAYDVADRLNAPPAELRRTLPQFTPETSAAIPADAAGRDKPAGVFMFSPTELNVDAKRFQFKSGGDEYGVTGALRSVEKWDPSKAQAIIAWQDKDGKLWVADGHQRSGLARRLTEQGKASGVELPGILYREADGISSEDVRAIAAVTNIANGSGSALDGAKVLRARPDLMDGSLPLSAGKGQQAAALAHLGDEAFRMIVNEVAPENFGALVGQLIPKDEARQVAAIKAIARFEPKNIEEASALVQRVAQSELAKAEEGRQTSMFDDLDSPESTAGEEMKIVGRAIKDLRKDKSLFARVLANAERIEASGSKIERASAQSEATEAEISAKVLASNAYTAGPVREALKAAAKDLKDGRVSISDATTRILSALRAEAETNGVDRAGAGGRDERGQAPTGTPEPATEAGPEGTRQSLIPGVDPVTDRDRIETAAAKPLAGGNADLPTDGLFGDAQGQKELFQGPRGKIVFDDNRRPIISLFKDADFSTLVHEGAHNYLDILSQYADRPEAPDDLKADWQTMKEWLKVGPDGQIDTPHHEKFARGFEQYIREGVAPSKALARVFGQMKQWMVSIYRTLRGLGEPISDDIRGVFDRMLAETPERTVIAPEDAGGPTLADIHEADAEHTEPAQADPVADRAAAEKAQTVAKPPQDIAHEVAPVAATEPRAAAPADAGKQAGAGAGAGGLLDKGSLDAGIERQSDGVGVGRGPDEPGRGQVAPEGPRAPAGNAGGPAAAGGGVSRADPGHPLAGQPAAALPGAKSKFIDDKAGNIRLDNIPDRIKLDDIKGALATDADPEAVVEQAIREVKDVLRKTAADNGGFIDDRRGKVSDEQTKREALQILGREPDRVLTKKIGEAFSSAEATAIQMMAARAAMDVRAKDMAVASAAYGTPEHVQALVEADGAKQFMALVQAKYAQATAEGGRTLRALRKLPEVWNPSAESADDFMKRQTGRTLFQSAMDARLRGGFDTQQQVAAYIADSGRYSFGRMILEYWINGLISGFATHTTYAVGNALLAANKIFLETPTAVAIGALRHAMGDTGPIVPWEEVRGQVAGVGRGLAPAIKASADALRTGLTTRLPGESASSLTGYQALSVGRPSFVSGAALDEAATMRDAMGAWYGVGRGMKDGLLSIGALLKAGGVEGAPLWNWEFSTRGAIPNGQYRGVTVAPIGDLARGPGRFIAAIHSFFRSINYSIEINGSEYRQAASEGLTGDMMARRIAELRNERTPDRIAEAMAANMPLFHVGEPPTDPMLARLSDARNAATQQTLMGQGGELTRRVSALTNWTPKIPGLGETPVLKFIDPFVTISANIIDQSLVQRTPLGFLSGEMRADILGRNGPLARDKAAARMLVGSVLASTFGILAAEGYVTGAGPQDPQKGALWRMAYQPHSVLLGDEWVDLHRLGPLGMLLGMSADLYDVAHTAQKEDLLTAAAHLNHAIAQNVLDESFMRGPAELIKAIEDKNYAAVYLRNFASSFVPYSVGMAQWARASDPYSRQARTLIDAIRAKVPGMSEDLLPKRTIFGDAMPHREAFAGANGLLSIWQQKVNSDPVVSEMLRVGFAPKMPEQRINNVKLNDQEYDDYAKMAGRLAKQRLDTYVHSAAWPRVPDPQKADLMRQIFSDSRHIAEQAIKAKYPHIGSDAYILKNTRTNGPRESID